FQPVPEPGRGGGGPGVAGVLPPVEIPNYVFTYVGEELVLESDTVEVLKRQKEIDGRRFASLLSGVDLGLVDLGRLQDLEVSNLTMVEDRPYGYGVHVSLDEGVVNIHQNWRQWYREGQVRQALTADSLPSDQEIIAIASRLVQDLGIDLTGYGEPEVERPWERYPDQVREDYLPEYVSVRYPRRLQDLPVYEAGGELSGLQISVDLVERRAVSVADLTVPQYVTSSYPAVTDAARVLEFVERGGLYPYYGDPESEKTITIEVGTPTLAYMRYYMHAPMTSDELYVPALVFPVSVPEGETFYRPNVVVPLADELLQEPDFPRPMPLLEAPVVEEAETAPAGDE
ncbi:hypothetical protein AMJ57_04865, partial [Parcubacteria bacterium SG8_24]